MGRDARPRARASTRYPRSGAARSDCDGCQMRATLLEDVPSACRPFTAPGTWTKANSQVRYATSRPAALIAGQVQGRLCHRGSVTGTKLLAKSSRFLSRLNMLPARSVQASTRKYGGPPAAGPGPFSLKRMTARWRKRHSIGGSSASLRSAAGAASTPPGAGASPLPDAAAARMASMASAIRCLSTSSSGATACGGPGSTFCEE
mmetsp:Transcript_54247/g.156808  ORF Transcript_54247/g.156808 Transcript_54247/m.156808 type:complete len:204 (-) Transcript_54247:898-1509(-)